MVHLNQGSATFLRKGQARLRHDFIAKLLKVAAQVKPPVCCVCDGQGAAELACPGSQSPCASQVKLCVSQWPWWWARPGPTGAHSPWFKLMWIFSDITEFSFLTTELADLPLVKLDFSCNKITEIPVCYRKLRHLQVIILDNNPMQMPPAQVSVKPFRFFSGFKPVQGDSMGYSTTLWWLWN